MPSEGTKPETDTKDAQSTQDASNNDEMLEVVAFRCAHISCTVCIINSIYEPRLVYMSHELTLVTSPGSANRLACPRMPIQRRPVSTALSSAVCCTLLHTLQHVMQHTLQHTLQHSVMPIHTRPVSMAWSCTVRVQCVALVCCRVCLQCAAVCCTDDCSTASSSAVWQTSLISRQINLDI